MYAFVDRPSPHFCRDVARKLVACYPFMKDVGKGSGYVSDAIVTLSYLIELIDTPVGIVGEEAD